MAKVIVREIKGTSNPEMMNVVFEQEVPRPVTDLNGLLNFANAGNSRFGNNSQKRVGFFNFSPEMVAKLGFVVGQPVDDQLNANLVVHEFCNGDIIPEEIQSYYDGAKIYHPRTWKVNEGQANERVETKQPKQTPKLEGRVQETLTYQGKPIYRETHLAMMDMVVGDLLVKHDNKITGSSNSNALAAVGRAIVG